MLKVLPLISALIIIFSESSTSISYHLLVQCQLSPWYRTELHLLELQIQGLCLKGEEESPKESIKMMFKKEKKKDLLILKYVFQRDDHLTKKNVITVFLKGSTVEQLPKGSC